jgi:hypothetical protein
VKNRYLILTAGPILFITFFFLSSCKKINEPTELGNDLIPAVDNVTTFDTTLSVETYNDLFTILNDSTRSSTANEHFLGEITNDPLFGKTEASLFLELKPNVYPFQFAAVKDSLHIDSVVLVLSYKGAYGDSVAPHNVNVFEIDPANNFRFDTSYLIRERPFASQGPLLGILNNVIPWRLQDSVHLFQEDANNQLRIKLNNSFGQRLLNYDTTVYKTDSAFKISFKGFEITATGGNSLLGFQLSDTNTKLAIYYRFTSNDQAAVTYFRSTGLSASANYVKRDYSGSQLSSYQGGVTPDNLVFIQNTPGSFATLKIPALRGLNNRIIHRAELIVEQVSDPSDGIFTPPEFLYLDAYDSAQSKFRTIPFDVAIDASGNLNFQSFGMVGKNTIDGSGNPIAIWRFNLSRYVQHVVAQNLPVYDLRLHTPYFTYNLYKTGTTDTELFIPVNTNYAVGRVRVGGGNHPTQRMRLHIIYSKI